MIFEQSPLGVYVFILSPCEIKERMLLCQRQKHALKTSLYFLDILRIIGFRKTTQGVGSDDLYAKRVIASALLALQ